MAKTVNQAFEEFNKDVVNLIKAQTDNARSSRDWLIEQLANFPSSIQDFPQDYPSRHIKFGSFARNTKIRPLDDIDLMYCLDGSNATYIANPNDRSQYKITTTYGSEDLKKLSNLDNTLNSIKVINKLIYALSSVPQYSNADIKRNQEAAVLNLISYTWNYDIVPCFYTDCHFYLIPDGVGLWKAANPKIDQENLKSTNINYGGSVYQLIRTLKYWNANFASPQLSSYFFEILVINFVNSSGSQSKYIDINIKDFFNYLSVAIWKGVPDPKGIQGDLNYLTLDQRDRISQQAKSCYIIVFNASDLGINKNNNEQAIKNWKLIFGDKFPSYE